MSIIILFGLPGAGKTYVGKVLSEHFGYFHYDGDNDLPEEMRRKIVAAQPITDTLRDEFFKNIVQSVKRLEKEHNKLALSQTFIREKYRQQVLDSVPEARFLLIQTDTKIREKRLQERTDFPLDLAYTRKMVENFDKPLVEHKVISNNEDGKEKLLQQLKKLID